MTVQDGTGQVERQLAYQFYLRCGTMDNQIVVIVLHVVVFVCFSMQPMDFLAALVTGQSYCHCVREMLSR